MKTALAGMHNLVAQQAHMIATSVGGAIKLNTDYMDFMPSAQTVDTESINRLTPQAKNIYFMLQNASTRKAEGMA
jgi:hypothetical protein